MNNVISINTRRVLGASSQIQTTKRFPDAAVFLTGVILSVVLPESIYCVYGGLLPLIAFAGSALAGTIVGLVMYQSPYRGMSCVSTDSMPQAQSSKPVTLKRAA